MKVPPFGSIYSEVEERILGPWQRIRQRLLTPIASLFLGHCSPQPHVALCRHCPLFFLSYQRAELLVVRLPPGITSSEHQLLEIEESFVNIGFPYEPM